MSDPCHGCGECCKRLLVEIKQADVDREPQLLPVVRPVNGLFLLTNHKSCPMLDGDRCSIHDTRPEICRKFPVGGQHCNLLRELAGLPTVQAAS